MAKKLKRTAAKRTPVAGKKARLELPDAPKPVDEEIANYITLIYGREKIGKTTLAASFPNVIFLATEPGLRGVSVHSFNDDGGGVVDWSVFRQAVDALVRDGADRFKTVVVDTVDRAYDMCLDWVCENRGIEYPGKDKAGREDYGKSWRAVKVEFLEQIHQLVNAGYGVVFISHAKEVTIETRTGDKFEKIYPTMSGQARAVVEALVDFFFYAEYARDEHGQQVRVLVCRGDEMVWAGARSTPGEALTGQSFPALLPLERVDGYDILQEAFMGERSGIDAGSLFDSRVSTKSGGRFIMSQRTKAKRTKGGKQPTKKAAKKKSWKK